MYADVVFAIAISQKFTYLVPEVFDDVVQPGVRVLVPFGHRKTTGYVVGIAETYSGEIALKSILDVLDTAPVLSPSILQLAEWIANYYLCGFGEVLKAALPPGIAVEAKRTVVLQWQGTESELGGVCQPKSTQAKILRLLLRERKMRVDMLQKKLRGIGLQYSLTKLVEHGLVSFADKLVGRSNLERREKYIKFAQAATDTLPDLAAGAKKQREVMALLRTLGGIAKYQAVTGAIDGAAGAIAALVRRGVLTGFERRIERDYYGDLRVEPAPDLVLNREQKAAVEQICTAIQKHETAVFLIHGVTGSGKTQVYIEAIRENLRVGRDAIVLVPEISLTPQTVRRFRSVFQEQVTVLHSRMSNGERYDAWRRILDGAAHVVVGPRSAIFAPVQNLGIIVVDEEHEGSYKQSENSPRYHARDIAVVRGKLESAVVVLGSATPSLESYTNAKKSKYRLLEMKNRIDDVAMPEVRLIDMARERRQVPRDKQVIFSRLLVEKIEEKLARKEQIIILQNRRGYSSAVRCRDCGHVLMCPDCNISMSYHLQGLRMRCHYCNSTQKAPEICPECQSFEIDYLGVGTQRVETQIAELFPQARLVRMDLDTTRGRLAHDKILQDFGNHKYDILLGTQMIAKGLDFERVTLVGVISADTGLYLPDFRASERTFQLLTQVAGRAGRKSTRGEVIIQTYSPNHVCLQAASNHDFVKFYYQEIHDRRALDYPPMTRLALIQFKYADESKALEATNKFAEILRNTATGFVLLGPAPAPLSRLQKAYRFQVILKSDKTHDASASQMRQALATALEVYRKQTKYSRVRVTIDVDPVVIL